MYLNNLIDTGNKGKNAQLACPSPGFMLPERLYPFSAILIYQSASPPRNILANVILLPNAEFVTQPINI